MAAKTSETSRPTNQLLQFLKLTAFWENLSPF
jgi:hypothetical protein